MICAADSEEGLEAHNTFTLHVATRYGKEGVTCNVVSPSMASTEGRFVTGQILCIDGGVSMAFAHVADNRQQFEDHKVKLFGGAA